MVPARGAKDRLDRPVASQKRRILPSESSQAHHGRRGQTSITLRISTTIFKITLFFSSESALYDAILQREHYFYNRFHAKLHWLMKYTQMSKNIKIASLFP